VHARFTHTVQPLDEPEATLSRDSIWGPGGHAHYGSRAGEMTEPPLHLFLQSLPWRARRVRPAINAPSATASPVRAPGSRGPRPFPYCSTDPERITGSPPRGNKLL